MTYGGEKRWSQDVSDTKISADCLGNWIRIKSKPVIIYCYVCVHVSDSRLFQRWNISDTWAESLFLSFSLICLCVQTGSRSRASSRSFDAVATNVTPAGRNVFFFLLLLLLNLSLRLNLSWCIQQCRDCQLCVQFADALGVFVFCLHNQGNQKWTDGKILGPFKWLRRKLGTMSNLREAGLSLPLPRWILSRVSQHAGRFQFDWRSC